MEEKTAVADSGNPGAERLRTGTEAGERVGVEMASRGLSHREGGGEEKESRRLGKGNVGRAEGGKERSRGTERARAGRRKRPRREREGNAMWIKWEDDASRAEGPRRKVVTETARYRWTCFPSFRDPRGWDAEQKGTRVRRRRSGGIFLSR